MFFNRYLMVLITVLMSACSMHYEESNLSKLQQEEVFALTKLPCIDVGVKNPWNKHDYDFLCNMGKWGSMSYFFYEDKKANGQVDKIKFIWKDYDGHSFFPSNESEVKEILNSLSDRFTPNDRSSMVGFANRLNTYSFSTNFLKVKHSAEYYAHEFEPYFLHVVTLQKLNN